MRVVIILSLILASASAASVAVGQKIVGGSLASIALYPSMANLIQSFDGTFFIPTCAGTIINSRSILTTASCLPPSTQRIRARVGSSLATSGGTILVIDSLVFMGNYNPITHENDIGMARTVQNGIFFVVNAIMPAQTASATSVIPDNSPVRIAGWGRTEFGHFSEQLRHAEMRVLNSRVCQDRLGSNVMLPNSMLCTNWAGGLSPDHCQGDNGSPIFLNSIVVGVVSRPGCGNFFTPSISTRVSSFSSFISLNS